MFPDTTLESGCCRSPREETVRQPLVEHIAGKRKHFAIYVEVIAFRDWQNIAQVVCKSVVGGQGIEVSELGNIINELQHERDLCLVARFYEDNSILVPIIRCVRV